MKGRQKIVCLTAYDCTMGQMVDEAGVHLVLVGDSLAMTVLGYSSTLPVTMDQMIHHTAAVVRGVKNALVVADMPFMSYHSKVDQAVANAGRFIKEAGAEAVKIEGGAVRAPAVRAMVASGIPVLGHIGLTPQSIKTIGGYKVQGKGAKAARALLADAVALEKAGAFAVVLECVPRAVGRQITRRIRIPTIGIGAGPDCDGQILVCNDLLGLYPADAAPKLTFVKRYAALGKTAAKAIAAYKSDVEKGLFPGKEHCF